MYILKTYHVSDQSLRGKVFLKTQLHYTDFQADQVIQQSINDLIQQRQHIDPLHFVTRFR